ALQKIPKSNFRSGSSPASSTAFATYLLVFAFAAHCSRVGSLEALPPPAPRPPRCGAAAWEYIHAAVTRLIAIAIRILFNITTPSNGCREGWFPQKPPRL